MEQAPGTHQPSVFSQVERDVLHDLADQERAYAQLEGGNRLKRTEWIETTHLSLQMQGFSDQKIRELTRLAQLEASIWET